MEEEGIAELFMDDTAIADVASKEEAWQVVTDIIHLLCLPRPQDPGRHYVTPLALAHGA